MSCFLAKRFLITSAAVALTAVHNCWGALPISHATESDRRTSLLWRAEYLDKLSSEELEGELSNADMAMCQALCTELLPLYMYAQPAGRDALFHSILKLLNFICRSKDNDPTNIVTMLVRSLREAPTDGREKILWLCCHFINIMDQPIAPCFNPMYAVIMQYFANFPDDDDSQKIILKTLIKCLKMEVNEDLIRNITQVIFPANLSSYACLEMSKLCCHMILIDQELDCTAAAWNQLKGLVSRADDGYMIGDVLRCLSHYELWDDPNAETILGIALSKLSALLENMPRLDSREARSIAYGLCQFMNSERSPRYGEIVAKLATSKDNEVRKEVAKSLEDLVEIPELKMMCAYLIPRFALDSEEAVRFWGAESLSAWIDNDEDHTDRNGLMQIIQRLLEYTRHDTPIYRGAVGDFLANLLPRYNGLFGLDIAAPVIQLIADPDSDVRHLIARKLVERAQGNKKSELIGMISAAFFELANSRINEALFAFPYLAELSLVEPPLQETVCGMALSLANAPDLFERLMVIKTITNLLSRIPAFREGGLDMLARFATQDPDIMVQVTAATNLGILADEIPQLEEISILDPLIALARKPDQNVRHLVITQAFDKLARTKTYGSRMLEPLYNSAMSDPDLGLRSVAAVCLAKLAIEIPIFTREEVLNPLIPLLAQNISPEIRSTAIQALTTLALQENFRSAVVPLLKGLTQDSNQDVQNMAVCAFSGLMAKVPELREYGMETFFMLTDPKNLPAIRCVAMRGLAALTQFDEFKGRVLERLAFLAKDRDLLVRSSTMIALAELSLTLPELRQVPAVDWMLQVITQNTTPSVKHKAIRALVALGSTERFRVGAAEALLRLAQQGSPELRRLALSSFMELLPSAPELQAAGITELLRLARDDRDLSIRTMAATALGDALLNIPTLRATGIPAFLDLLTPKMPTGVRCAAIKFLGKLILGIDEFRQQGLGELVRLMTSDTDADVRLKAAKTIATLAGHIQELLGPTLEMLHLQLAPGNPTATRSNASKSLVRLILGIEGVRQQELPKLIQLMASEGEEPQVRLTIARELAAVAPNEPVLLKPVVQTLFSLTTPTNPTNVRCAVIQPFAQLTLGIEELREIGTNALLQLGHKDADPFIKMFAARALATSALEIPALRQMVVVDLLAELMTSGAPQIKIAAMQDLAKLYQIEGFRGRVAEATLSSARRDPDASVRISAAKIFAELLRNAPELREGGMLELEALANNDSDQEVKQSIFALISSLEPVFMK